MAAMAASVAAGDALNDATQIRIERHKGERYSDGTENFFIEHG